MSGSETTPRKQSRLEWSFKKGGEKDAKEGGDEGGEEGAEKGAEKGADSGTEQWAACTPSPFKKLRSVSSPEQWKAFTKELEVSRLLRIKEADDRGF